MLGRNFTQNDSRLFSEFDRQEEIDAEKRALRELLDSFRTEPETLFEETISHPATRRNIGKFIGHALVKPYAGEK